MATAAPDTRTKTDTRTETDEPVPWNVVLLNDEEHTFDYVIRMMRELFNHSEIKAKKIAEAVDKEGRAICLTTHKEHAEFKRDQIHAFGADQIIEGCAGAMSATIEPAEFGGEDDEDHGSGNR